MFLPLFLMAVVGILTVLAVRAVAQATAVVRDPVVSLPFLCGSFPTEHALSRYLPELRSLAGRGAATHGHAVWALLSCSCSV